MVLAARSTFAAVQVAKFRSIFLANARPTQTINQRFVLEIAKAQDFHLEPTLIKVRLAGRLRCLP
jgi:hypothetical protein